MKKKRLIVAGLLAVGAAVWIFLHLSDVSAFVNQFTPGGDDASGVTDGSQLDGSLPVGAYPGDRATYTAPQVAKPQSKSSGDSCNCGGDSGCSGAANSIVGSVSVPDGYYQSAYESVISL